MKYLLIALFFIYNSYASSPQAWQKLYDDIQNRCEVKIYSYYPHDKFTKIGKVEISPKNVFTIIFLFKNKEEVYFSCYYTQEDDIIEINQFS